MRKNIWKDQTGRSIFAKDSDNPGQVALINQGINVPSGALPAHAKQVVHQHQFRRRYVRDSDEDDDEDRYSDEEGEHYRKPSGNTKTTLSDFLSERDQPIVKQQSQSDSHSLSPTHCIAAVKENISLIKTLSASDPLYEEIKQNLTLLKNDLIQLIEQPQDDTIMSQLLFQVEAINDI